MHGRPRVRQARPGEGEHLAGPSMQAEFGTRRSHLLALVLQVQPLHQRHQHQLELSRNTNSQSPAQTY